MSYLGRDVREVAGPVFCEGGEELDHDDDEVRKLDGIESAVLLRLVLVFDVLEFVEDLESVLPVVDFVGPLLCNGSEVVGEEALGAFQSEEADDDFRSDARAGRVPASIDPPLFQTELSLVLLRGSEVVSLHKVSYE